jgi:antirestriction protein ArdC
VARKSGGEERAPRRDVREELTNRIIESLEKGVVPWSKPWVAEGAPHNGISGRPYHGGNRVMLSWIARENEWRDPRWMTFNQARSNGWMVGKGEHGVRVEYWKPPEQTQANDGKEQPEQTRDGEEQQAQPERRGWRVFTATVFNANQVLAPVVGADGEPVLERGEDGKDRVVMKPLAEVQPYAKRGVDFVPIERAKAIIESIGADVRHGGDRAFYSARVDAIQLPNPQSFHSIEDYYATSLHEHAHWTGHESRMNREGITSPEARFGSTLYAKEELRAELASVFLADETGVTLSESHFANHAAYIGGWVSVLKESKHEIFAASRDAERISDYLLDLAAQRALERERGRDVEQERSLPPRAVVLEPLVDDRLAAQEVPATSPPARSAAEPRDIAVEAARLSRDASASVKAAGMPEGLDRRLAVVNAVSEGLTQRYSVNELVAAALETTRDSEPLRQMAEQPELAHVIAPTLLAYEAGSSEEMFERLEGRVVFHVGLLYEDGKEPSARSWSDTLKWLGDVDERVREPAALEGLANVLHGIGANDVTDAQLEAAARGAVVLATLPASDAAKALSQDDAAMMRSEMQSHGLPDAGAPMAGAEGYAKYVASGTALVNLIEETPGHVGLDGPELEALRNVQFDKDFAQALEVERDRGAEIVEERDRGVSIDESDEPELELEELSIGD